jgi:hypothetical protein
VQQVVAIDEDLHRRLLPRRQAKAGSCNRYFTRPATIVETALP